MEKQNKFIGTSLFEEISVDKLYTVHYFEYTKDYTFEGEFHDFWEFLYVDRGAINITAGENIHRLIKGDIIFHKPNEFHNVEANGRIAPNLIVVSFSSQSKAMSFFEKKIIRIDAKGREYLTHIINEAQYAFSSDLRDHTLTHLERRSNRKFGSEQMIKLNLQLFLLNLLRREMNLISEIKREGKDHLASPLKDKVYNLAFTKSASYMEENLRRSISLYELSQFVGYSTTYLERIFKEKTGFGVMEYYKHLKLEEVKQLIREGNHSFTQIADLMGYTSVQYFSKTFKRYIGMTPSEYSQSVKLNLN